MNFSNQDKEKPQDIFSSSYNAQDFKRDLSSGQLRWLATLLALANIGLLAFTAFDSEEPVMYFPVHTRGAVVWWVFSFTLLVWTVLAVVNWRTWIMRQRAESAP